MGLLFLKQWAFFARVKFCKAYDSQEKLCSSEIEKSACVSLLQDCRFSPDTNFTSPFLNPTENLSFVGTFIELPALLRPARNEAGPGVDWTWRNHQSELSGVFREEVQSQSVALWHRLLSLLLLVTISALTFNVQIHQLQNKNQPLVSLCWYHCRMSTITANIRKCFAVGWDCKTSRLWWASAGNTCTFRVVLNCFLGIWFSYLT